MIEYLIICRKLTKYMCLFGRELPKYTGRIGGIHQALYTAKPKSGSTFVGVTSRRGTWRSGKRDCMEVGLTKGERMLGVGYSGFLSEWGNPDSGEDKCRKLALGTIWRQQVYVAIGCYDVVELLYTVSTLWWCCGLQLESFTRWSRKLLFFFNWRFLPLAFLSCKA